MKNTWVLLLLLLATNANADEVTCLSKNIYHEARGTTLHPKAREAVAKVTLNRVNSDIFPNDICSVVFQPSQFSWTMNSDRVIDDFAVWNEINTLAYNIVYKGYDPYPGLKSMWFHDNSISSPNWTKFLKREVVMSPIIFYRER